MLGGRSQNYPADPLSPCTEPMAQIRAMPPDPFISKDLTPADVAEFKALFLQETGKGIDDATAEVYARNLINLVEMVVRLS